MNTFCWKKYSIILVAFSLCSHVIAQINHGGKPVFNPMDDTLFVPMVNIVLDEGYEMHRKDGSGLHHKDSDFAIPVDVNISPEEYGVWRVYPHLEKKVWFLRVLSENAQSLNFVFGSFNLIPGCKLFLYNKSQSKVIGALTHKNNKPWNSLATDVISTNEVYLELQLPMHFTEYGSLVLNKIGVELSKQSVLKEASDRWFDASAYCQENINCYTDVNYQKQKRAACRILYNSTSRCTGTLLNNLNNDKTPYVITAAHCFTNEFVANNAVFTFNYESPSCENIDGSISQSISGATIVSYSPGLDFLLLRLSETPPLDFNVLYSGWDARGVTPSSSYSIHHPEGDVKKISIDDDPSQTNSFPGFDPNTHWLVLNYEVGSSEFGSSGSGLISNENLLIGTLTGGNDVCLPDIRDRYQKFSHSYNDYFSPENQLKAWLDPNNTNQLTCQPSEKFIPAEADFLTNLLTGEASFHVQQQGGWGYLSGHNYQGNQMFAERFRINGSKYLYGAIIDSIFHSTNLSQKVTFTVWKGGDTPGNILYEYEYDAADADILVPMVNIEFDSTILVHKDFYFGYQINYKGDTFSVKTAETVPETNSAYTFINGSWQPLQLDNTPIYSKLALGVIGFDYRPNIEEVPDTSLIPSYHLYPNPSRNQFQILFKEEPLGKTEYIILDLTGRVVYSHSTVNQESNYPIVHNLPAGVYLLTIITNGTRQRAHKLVVL
jgi:hypothetical protein